MTLNDSDNEINEKPQKPMGRPRNPNRWNPDGTLKTDVYTLYFKEHYHKPHTCEYCGKVRKCSDNVARHQKSARCVAARKKLGLTLAFSLVYVL
jgi:hypothetical protein